MCSIINYSKLNMRTSTCESGVNVHLNRLGDFAMRLLKLCLLFYFIFKINI